MISAHTKPFRTDKENNLETVNECIILIINYHLIYFTDFCDDAYVRAIVGWSLITVTSIFILINFWHAFSGVVSDAFKKLKVVSEEDPPPIFK